MELKKKLGLEETENGKSIPVAKRTFLFCCSIYRRTD